MKLRLLTQAVLTACILLLFTAVPCTAQGGAGDPLCVANLRAEAGSTGGVRLSWSLPEGPSRGKVLFFAIYRDQRPIYSSTRVKSLFPIAAVPKNHIAYTDETDDGTPYYYAVLTFVDEKEDDEAYRDLYYDEELDGPDGEDQTGREDTGMLYAVILPGINATISPVQASAAPGSSSRSAESLTGTASESGPLHTATTDTPRNADTPRTADTLHTADTPRTADRMLQADLAPRPAGTGSDSIREAQRLREEAFLREEAETLNKERSIRPDTERMAADLYMPRHGSGRRAAPLFRHIFSEDQVLPSGGDDYLLYAILQESWLSYRYREAKAELSAFLAQRRDTGPTERATFYLAEAEYFTGNYLEALNLFVSVQDSFPQLAGKWIDSCLDLM